MSVFSKRVSIQQNMAFMGVMAAINIIIAVVAALSSIAGIFLILILPLTSVLVAIYCENKYFPIYAIATFGLSIVATLWNMQTTFFYVLPSLITGYVFGYSTKHKIHPVWSILCSSIIQGGITFAFIPLINFIFEVDIIGTFKTAFGLTSSTSVDIIIPSFILAISLVQIILSFIIISNEVKKFGFAEINTNFSLLLFGIIGSVLPLSLFGFYFLSLRLAYVVLILSFYFAVFIVFELINLKYYRSLILVGISVLINIFVFALATSSLKENSSLLLLGVTPFCISTISLVVSFLQKKQEQIKY